MARWFGPKKIGFGASPRGWQGWAATAVFLAAIVGVRFMPTQILSLSHWVRAALGGLVLVVFLLVVWLKCEPD